MDESKNKKTLSDYTLEELYQLDPKEVYQMYLDTLKKIVEVTQSITQHISQLEEYRKKAEQSGDEATASEYREAIDSAKSHIANGMVSCQEIVEDIQKEAAKTLSRFSGAKEEREKALTEALSSGARANDEYMQRKRDERYEKMIEEAGEIESPASRFKK